MGRGFDIPWVRGSKYHGMGDQNIMSKGVKIPWVEFQFSIYCYNIMQN
jgi:hypothetical protein